MGFSNCVTVVTGWIPRRLMKHAAVTPVGILPGVEILSIKTSVQTLLPKGTLKSIEPSKGGKQPKKVAKGSAPVPDDKSAADKETTAADESEGSSNAETPKAGEKN